MKPNNHKQYALDSFCKKVFKNDVRNYYDEVNRLRDKKVSFSELSEQRCDIKGTFCFLVMPRARSPPHPFSFPQKTKMEERQMFDNSCIYTLRTEDVEGMMRYYVSFADGQATPHEVEVSRPVYLEFLSFVKIECSLGHWNERHREHSELTDETLHRRALRPPKSVEDTTLDSLRSEQLRLAVESLAAIQRRRFVLYHEFGLTYEQIAKMEGCTFQAVAKTVKSAEATVKKFIQT